jgi:predicted amidohydrolase YtcJ
MPVRSSLDDGATIGAGTDTVRPFDPMLTIWGLVTRNTKDIGAQGPTQAVDQYTAIELYTSAGAPHGRSAPARQLEPKRLADMVAYRSDPVTIAIDELPSLKPAFTHVGGRATYDRDGLFNLPADQPLTSAEATARIRGRLS